MLAASQGSQVCCYACQVWGMEYLVLVNCPESPNDAHNCCRLPRQVNPDLVQPIVACDQILQLYKCNTGLNSHTILYISVACNVLLSGLMEAAALAVFSRCKAAS